MSSASSPSACSVADVTEGTKEWLVLRRSCVAEILGREAIMKTEALLLAIVFSTAAGCGASFEQLQSRAGFDFECPPAAITAHTMDDETTIAQGCGKEAVYVEHCTGNNHSRCTWMLNSPVRAATAAAK